MGSRASRSSQRNLGQWARAGATLIFSSALLLTSCKVGPNYHRPPAPVPSAYKEAPPPDSPQATEWVTAQPSDALARGKWWEIYNDAELNALEEQVNISNQNIKQAEAQYREARLNVKIARSYLFPTITTNPSITYSRNSLTAIPGANSFTRTTYDLPVETSYEIDLWGAVRREYASIQATAQASEATLENARLSYQAQLAQDYFELRGTDGDEELL